MNLTIEDSTHYLICKHCIGSARCKDYYMNCVILKKTKSNKIKIIVFGERNWKGKDHIKRIRYVKENKLILK